MQFKRTFARSCGGEQRKHGGGGQSRSDKGGSEKGGSEKGGSQRS